MKSCDRRTNTHVLRLTINSGRPIRPHSRSREWHTTKRGGRGPGAAFADHRATIPISACRSISFRLRHKVLLKHTFFDRCRRNRLGCYCRKAIGFVRFLFSFDMRTKETKSSRNSKLKVRPTFCLRSVALLWFSRLIVFIVISCGLAANRNDEKAMNQR